MARYCAIDTETTGLIPRFNDIIEIAVVLLDDNFDMDPTILPFHTYILPSRPENVNIEALKVQHTNDPSLDKTYTLNKFKRVMEFGMEGWKVADLFVEWFENLHLPPKSRIIPMGHNYSFDKEFMVDWLGPKSYDYTIHHKYRDSNTVCSFINDCAANRGEKLPFPYSTRLTDVCNILGLKLEKAHSALDDAIAAAQVYRRLMRYVPDTK